VFGTLDTAKRPFTAADRALSKELGTYWVNFVRTGDPNGEGAVPWPRYTAELMEILELGEPTRTRPILEHAQLTLFDQLVKSGGAVALF
jgi:para-nitrobenzyl esterase